MKHALGRYSPPWPVLGLPTALTDRARDPRMSDPGDGSVSESRGQFKHSPRRRIPPQGMLQSRPPSPHPSSPSPAPTARPLTGTYHQRSRSPCQLLTARATKSTTMPRMVCSKRRIQRSRCLSQPGASGWRSSQFNRFSSIPHQQTARSGLSLRQWTGLSC